MKTIFGAIVAIVIIILIVVFTRSSHQDAVPADTSSVGTPSLSGTDTTQSEPSMQNDTPAEASAKLVVTTTKEGTGTGAANGDKVTVNYTGKLTNGTTFDSNVDPKFNHVTPFTFTLGVGMVIPGWDQGVLGMKKGEKRHLVIPATLGYGAQGAAGGAIPPNATLEFDVEVVSIAK